MGFFKRLFGICATQLPANDACWSIDGDTLTIELDKAPELSSPGGAIRLEDKSGKLPTRVLVVHGNDGAYHAFENKCTHAGRRLDPLAGEEVIQCCSIGKTVFDYNGGLQSGSGKTDLKTFPVEPEEGTLTISLAG